MYDKTYDKTYDIMMQPEIINDLFDISSSIKVKNYKPCPKKDLCLSVLELNKVNKDFLYDSMQIASWMFPEQPRMSIKFNRYIVKDNILMATFKPSIHLEIYATYLRQLAKFHLIDYKRSEYLAINMGIFNDEISQADMPGIRKPYKREMSINNIRHTFDKSSP